MPFDFLFYIEQCLLLIQEYVPVTLVLYSHIPAAVLSLIVGLFVVVKGGRSYANISLLLLCVVFSLWSLFDIFLWTSSDSRVYMFLWSFMGFFEILLFIVSFLFFYFFVNNKPPSFIVQLFLFSISLPVVLSIPTQLSLGYFDAIECVPVEGVYKNTYLFYAKSLLFACLVWFGFSSIKKATGVSRKSFSIILFGLVILLSFFLVADTITNYFLESGEYSVTQAYTSEFYWLFGMPIFLGILAYTIVKFHSFQIKLFGAQVLVFSLFALISSQFIFIKNTTNLILNSISLFLLVLFGYILVKSVQKEIQQKENAAKLAKDLVLVNNKLKELDKQKSEFLSIAAHQLRTPLSIIKGYVSLIQDGAYGKFPVKANPILQNIEESNERLVKLVDDFLDVSRLEQGRTKFSFGSVNFVELVKNVIAELGVKAEQKNITIHFVCNADISSSVLIGDEERLRHGIFNYIDNAIKYSPTNTEISVHVEYADNKITYRVVDQGVGMDENDLQNLFQKFYRSPKVLNEFQGTGLGLYVVKEFIEAHSGEVFAKSEGFGRGSEFGFWIPLQPHSDMYTQWVDEHKSDIT